MSEDERDLCFACGAPQRVVAALQTEIERYEAALRAIVDGSVHTGHHDQYEDCRCAEYAACAALSPTPEAEERETPGLDKLMREPGVFSQESEWDTNAAAKLGYHEGNHP